jgi:phage shock protein PspC (stress-responsive transcriptional regulator)
MIMGENTMVDNEVSDKQRERNMVTARMIVGTLREGLGDGYDLDDALVVMANVASGLLGASLEAEYVRAGAYHFIADFIGRVDNVYDVKIAQMQASKSNLN